MAEFPLKREHTSIVANPPTLPDLVYRGLKNKKCIDAERGAVTPEAYIRRDGEAGISVGTSPRAVRQLLETLKGIARLAVRDIRSIVNRATSTSLDVVLDSPAHGNIMGVPCWSQDRVTAESLAGDLARISALLPPDQP